jgi:hypothetical protein
MVTLLDDDGAAMGEPVLLHRPPFGGNNRKDIFKKQESQLEHLTSMMPRASFGKGGETVIDISIRDALRELIRSISTQSRLAIFCFLTQYTSSIPQS